MGDLFSFDGMVLTLIRTYLINFIYIITKAVVFVISCYMSWRIFDWMEKIDMRAEITERKNLGAAIMMASIFLGLGYVIGQI